MKKVLIVSLVLMVFVVINCFAITVVYTPALHTLAEYANGDVDGRSANEVIWWAYREDAKLGNKRSKEIQKYARIALARDAEKGIKDLEDFYKGLKKDYPEESYVYFASQRYRMAFMSGADVKSLLPRLVKVMAQNGEMSKWAHINESFPVSVVDERFIKTFKKPKIYNNSATKVCFDYEVEAGDNFSTLCKNFLGHGGRKTYMTEAERLGIDDPNRIYPGQIFRFEIKK